MARDLFQRQDPAELVPDYKLPESRRGARDVGLTKVGGAEPAPKQDVLAWIDSLPRPEETAPPPPERGAMDAATDVAKSFGAGAVQAAGAITRGVGELATRDWAKDWAKASPIVAIARGLGLIPKIVQPETNPLERPAAAIERGAESVRKSMTPEGKALDEGSRAKGDLFDPSTWSLGDNPTLQGYALRAANTFGQFLPQLVTLVLPNLGVTLSAAQSSGAGAKEAREIVSSKSTKELAAGSPRFRELVDSGLAHEAAKARLVREAELLAAEMTAPVGAVGGAATGALLSKAGGGAAAGAVAGMTGVTGRLARGGVTGALSAGEEGLQEVAEGVEARRGVNAATGLGVNPTEGSFGNLVEGAMGGGVPGTARGLMTGPTSTSPPPADPAPGTAVVPAGPGGPTGPHVEGLGGDPVPDARFVGRVPPGPDVTYTPPLEGPAGAAAPGLPAPAAAGTPALPAPPAAAPVDAAGLPGTAANPQLSAPADTGPAFAADEQGNVRPLGPDERMADQARAGDMARREGWLEGQVGRMVRDDEARAAELGMRPERVPATPIEGVLPGDILFKGQRPFAFESSARAEARKIPGAEVAQVKDGWVVRRPGPGTTTEATPAPATAEPGGNVATPAAAPAPAKPAAEPKLTRRQRFAQDNPFLAFVARHGVSLDEKLDITGERGRQGNKLVPYYGWLFRQKGLRLDMLAERAVQAGWLSQADPADPSDNGGTRKLAEMIMRAQRGEQVLDAEGQIRELEAEAAYDAEQGSLLDETSTAPQPGTDPEAQAEREAIQAEADFIAETATDDELEALIEAALYGDKEITDDEATDALGDAAPDAPVEAGAVSASPDGQGAPASPAGGADATVAGSPDSSGDAGGEKARDGGGQAAEGFGLTQPTPSGLARAEDALRRSREEKAKRDAAPDSAEFTLTGSDRAADQAAARGQMELVEAGNVATASDSPAGGNVATPDPGPTLAQRANAAVKPAPAAAPAPAPAAPKPSAAKRADAAPGKRKAPRKPKAAPRVSRSPRADARFAGDILTELAVHDEMFKLPRSEAGTLVDVVADLDPTLEHLGRETLPDGEDWNGATARDVFRNALGKNAYVYERGRELWLDISRFNEGTGGDSLYQALANFAHNAKRTFVGDPAGLSEAAIIRRTYHMLGSALRFGTTEHFQPAQEQLDGRPDAGISPLKWTGTDADKVAALIETFYATQAARFPNIRNARYDFDQHAFVRVSDGRRLDPADVVKVATDRGRAAYAGGRTARAGIVVQSLLQSPGRARPGLLEQVLRQSRQLVEQGGFAPLFSRPAQDAGAPFVERMSPVRRNLTGSLLGSRRVRQPSRAQEDALADLQAALRRQARGAGLPESGIDALVPHGVPYAARALAAALERLFEVRVQFVGGVGALDTRLSFDGVYIGGKTVFVASDSTKPFHRVIGHEFLHWLARTSPDTYASFQRRVAPMLRARAANEEARARSAQYEGLGLSDPAIGEASWEELYADMFGDAWSDPAFWREFLGALSPKLAQSIAGKWRMFMARIRLALGLESGDAINASPVLARIYSDAAAVRTAIAETMAEVANKKEPDGEGRGATQSSPTQAALIRTRRDPGAGEDSVSPPGPDIRRSARSPGQPGWRDQAGLNALSDGRQQIKAWLETHAETLGSLPDRRFYLAERYLAQGRIAEAEQLANGIRAAFKKATPKDKGQIYAYLTTEGAAPDTIIDNPAMRVEALKLKKQIGVVGDALVKAGLLTPASREKYRDQYLPRLYLAHLLNDNDWAAIGAGKKLSNMGYLKARRDIPEEERRVILGEITDPAYLGAMAVVRPMRDITLLAFIEKIAERPGLVMQKSMVSWKGKKVTPVWLKREAERLREQSLYMTDRNDAASAERIAGEMEKVAVPALRALGAEDTTDWKQMPDSPRYGRLRGLYVRKEVYEDLVGVYDLVPEDLKWYEPQSILGYGGVGTKATQWWKVGKVALNPGSQARNIVSNMVMLQLSGVALPMVVPRVVQAIKEIANRGPMYQVALRYGVTEATFASQELVELKRDAIQLQLETMAEHPIRRIMLLAQLMARPVIENATWFHQMMEQVGKTAKIIDEVEKARARHEADVKSGKAKGALDIEQAHTNAALEAHKWLLDYSLVPKSVRYLRNAPIGSPFLTWLWKSAPRLAEVALLHPQRLIPWVGMFASLPYLAALAVGGDDDDWRKMKELLPEWARKRGHVAALPWRDEAGRIQFADMGPFFPWTMYTDAFGNLLRGEPGAAATGVAGAVLSGGPIGSVLMAAGTGVDPFTDRPITNPGDPASRQTTAWLSYLWSLAMPPVITEMGFAGKAWQASSGNTNRYGDPRATGSQAALSLLGLNAYGINPDTTIAMEMSKMAREIRDTEIRLRQHLADRGLSSEKRAELIKEYTAEIQRRAQRASEYAIKAQALSPELKVQLEQPVPAR